MKRFLIAGLGLVLFGAGLYAGASGVMPFVAAAPEGPPGGADIEALWTAWSLLEAHHAPASTTEKIKTEEHVWGAIQGLAASYGDPYTVFFPPEEKKFFDSEVRGDFEGVGMEIGIRDDELTVISPIKGTPAERAGIKAGDRILAIDGEGAAGLSVEKAVSKIRGPGRTTVTLTLSRDAGKAFDIPVTRDTIILPTIDTTQEDDVFVITLYNFNANAPQIFRSALEEFVHAGTPYLVLDLRGNPGGYLEVAVDIASWFLPVGVPVVIEDYRDDQADFTHRSRGYDAFNDSLQLAVLIDRGSASAAEILAGALKEQGEATLIGTRSFGKGSVQQVFGVTGDTSLKITVARWLTPKGNSISDGGLAPDIEVEVTDDDHDAGRDPQLHRAIEFLKTGK